jgi:hypothetical protein
VPATGCAACALPAWHGEASSSVCYGVTCVIWLPGRGAQGLDAHHLPALQRRGLHADDAGPAAGAHPRHPGRAGGGGGAAARRPHHLLPQRPQGGGSCVHRPPATDTVLACTLAPVEMLHCRLLAAVVRGQSTGIRVKPWRPVRCGISWAVVTSSGC